jgi:hypothetical protein
MTWIEWLNSNSAAITAAASVVLTAITAYYAFLTWRLVQENRELREEHNRPRVVITTSLHEAHINIVHLMIENIGQGPAYEVKFETNRDVKLSQGRSLREVGVFKGGVRFLPPRQRIELFLHNAVAAVDNFKSSPIEITVRFKDSVGREASPEKFVIDLSEYENLRKAGKPPLYKLADALEELNRNFSHFLRGSGFPKIITYTPADYQKEMEELEKEASDFGFMEMTNEQLKEADVKPEAEAGAGALHGLVQDAANPGPKEDA